MGHATTIVMPKIFLIAVFNLVEESEVVFFVLASEVLTAPRLSQKTKLVVDQTEFVVAVLVVIKALVAERENKRREIVHIVLPLLECLVVGVLD